MKLRKLMHRVRRVTYPVLMCFKAWAYKHKLIKSTFSENIYTLYKALNNSYSELFEYVQGLFDMYIKGLTTEELYD